MKSSEVYCLGYRCRNSMDRSTYWRLCPRRAPQQLTSHSSGSKATTRPFAPARYAALKAKSPTLAPTSHTTLSLWTNSLAKLKRTQSISFILPNKKRSPADGETQMRLCPKSDGSLLRKHIFLVSFSVAVRIIVSLGKPRVPHTSLIETEGSISYPAKGAWSTELITPILPPSFVLPKLTIRCPPWAIRAVNSSTLLPSSK